MKTATDQTKTEKVHCNTCHGTTLHRLAGHTSESGSDEEQGFWWNTVCDMLQCCGCEDVVLRRTFRFSENDGDEVTFHPPKVARSLPKWQYSLPRDQREVLREVYRSLDAESVRLPVMGARTLIDMLMLDKVGDVGSFQQKLISLEQIGFLSKQNSEVLSAALEAGNAASHRGHAPTNSEVNAVMDIVENMLQAAYVFPKIARELRSSTPARVTKKSISNTGSKSKPTAKLMDQPPKVEE